MERKRYCSGRANTRPLGRYIYFQILPRSKRRKVNIWEIIRAMDREHIVAEEKRCSPGYSIE
jgi:hypothetical protein